MAPNRTYEKYDKHKAPKGWGSICQRSVTLSHAQELLRRAITEPGVDVPTVLYAVCGVAVFEGRPTRLETETWHGYPVPGSEVPPAVIHEFETRGFITREVARRLLKQREIPEACACK